MTDKYFYLLLPLILLYSCSGSSDSRGKIPAGSVKVGAEVLLEGHLKELEGKRVGLVMNPTARVEGVHMLDTLLNRGIDITALFAPEHGFRGEAGAGEVIRDGVDQATGLPVYSLYGESRKPTDTMLNKVDLLVFDMQDVGARFYTYNATLGLVLEAAAENNVPVWVLDRPNPAGGDYVAGWILQEEYQSFVGAYPIPMIHGMTLGELAKMMVGEEWIAFGEKPNLKIIPMKGWQRPMQWHDTGLEWFPPSPNLPTFEHAYMYLGTVLFEGTSVSEGRGTEDPFLKIGAPDTEISQSEIQMLREKYPAVNIETDSFTPRPIPGKSMYPKYKGEKCYGVNLQINDYDKFVPLDFGLDLLVMMVKNTKGVEIKNYINNLSGINLKKELLENVGALPQWEEEVTDFKKARKKYLIY